MMFRLGKFMNRPAIQCHKFLSIKFKGGKQCMELNDFRVFEYGSVKPYCTSRIIIEPEEWCDFRGGYFCHVKASTQFLKLSRTAWQPFRWVSTGFEFSASNISNTLVSKPLH
jgi:hypothetical protein